MRPRLGRRMSMMGPLPLRPCLLRARIVSRIWLEAMLKGGGLGRVVVVVVRGIRTVVGYRDGECVESDKPRIQPWSCLGVWIGLGGGECVFH